MGVYLWTENIQISSNLINSSLAQLQSEWWTWINVNTGTYSIGSNWLEWGWSSSANNEYVCLYRDCQELGNNNTVELHLKWTATRNYSAHSYQYNCFVCCWLCDSRWDTASYSIQWGYNTWSNAHGYIGINMGGSLLGNTTTTFQWGNMDIAVKINLGTWEIEYTCISPISFTSTTTLSSAQLETVRGYKYAYFWGNIFEWSVNTITISEATLRLS